LLFEGLHNYCNHTFKLKEALHKYLPQFPSDVLARRDKMVGQVETMLKLHKDLPKAKTPRERGRKPVRPALRGALRLELCL